MASDATSVTISSTNPGTANTPERTSGSVSAITATFLGASSSDTSKVVIQVQGYGAPNTPTIDNKNVVQLSVPGGTGTKSFTYYLVVGQSQSITSNWSFDVNVSVQNNGTGGGTLTFAKGTGGGGDKKK